MHASRPPVSSRPATRCAPRSAMIRTAEHLLDRHEQAGLRRERTPAECCADESPPRSREAVSGPNARHAEDLFRRARQRMAYSDVTTHGGARRARYVRQSALRSSLPLGVLGGSGEANRWPRGSWDRASLPHPLEQRGRIDGRAHRRRQRLRDQTPSVRRRFPRRRGPRPGRRRARGQWRLRPLRLDPETARSSV